MTDSDRLPSKEDDHRLRFSFPPAALRQFATAKSSATGIPMNSKARRILNASSVLAILLLWFTADSGGRLLTTIDSLCFSPDGASLIVSRLDGRDAEAPLRHCFANLARTITELDVSTGDREHVIRSDFDPGPCGVAPGRWGIGRICCLAGFSDGQMLCTTFGGGKVLTSGFSLSEAPTHSVLHLVRSPTGRYVAACGENQISLFDLTQKRIVKRIVVWERPFLRTPLAAFSTDEARLFYAGATSVGVLDLQTHKQQKISIALGDAPITSFAVAKDDSLIVCNEHWARRFDTNGKLLAELSDKGARLCAISADGAFFAVASDDCIATFDLGSSVPQHCHSCQFCTALACSTDGSMLAFASRDDAVHLLDARTGRVRWAKSVPGRNRWNRSLPILLFGVWCLVLILSRRSRR
ncbi:MAG: WD40 repeat domain-containing protein [Planctomycetaceae bacterium]